MKAMASGVDLSIVIPVFNSANFLLDLISRIYGSFFGNYTFEVIAINDGSTDRSEEYLVQAAKERKNFRFINQENKGPSIARQVGVNNSLGRYLIFVDCDDTFDEVHFFSLLSKAETDQCDIVETGYRIISESTRKSVKPKHIRLSQPVKRFLHNKTSMFLWDKIFSSSLFANVVFPPFYYSEDAVLLVQLYCNAQSVGVCREIHYNHYIRSSSLTGSYKTQMIDQVRSGLSILEMVKRNGLSYIVTAEYYICKYAAKNCINLGRIGRTDSKEYRFAKKAFLDHYRFFAFFALGIKREATWKSIVGIAGFRLLGK